MSRAIRILVLLLLCFSVATPAKRASTSTSRRSHVTTKSHKAKRVAKMKVKSHRRSAPKKSPPRSVSRPAVVGASR